MLFTSSNGSDLTPLHCPYEVDIQLPEALSLLLLSPSSPANTPSEVKTPLPRVPGRLIFPYELLYLLYHAMNSPRSAEIFILVIPQKPGIEKFEAHQIQMLSEQETEESGRES